MSRFTHHIFICQNERPPGDARGCCKARGSEEVIEAFKSQVHARGLKGKVRVNKAGCLDACATGVSIVVYPEGVWYGQVTAADVPEILEKHIVGGQPVERLRTYVPKSKEAPGFGFA